MRCFHWEAPIRLAHSLSTDLLKAFENHLAEQSHSSDLIYVTPRVQGGSTLGKEASTVLTAM